MELSPFLWSLLWNIFIAIAIIVVVLIVKIVKNTLSNYIDYITAVTVWLLLGIIFLWFIPRLMDSWLEANTIGIFLLVWLFLFYILELFLHWHHCKDLDHDSACHSHHTHEHESGVLMFGGTFLHNVFHGIVLFSAFAIDIHFWIATTVAVLLHSIPQNVVNYVMNHNNPRYAYIAAFWGVFGALMTYPFSHFLVENKFYILAIIAWGLLYTALADIFPEYKEKGTTTKKIVYLVFIIVWIVSFVVFERVTGHDHNHNHWHEEEIHTWEDHNHENEKHQDGDDHIEEESLKEEGVDNEPDSHEDVHHEEEHHDEHDHE